MTMDWTSLFEEDGNEDPYIPQLIERRLSTPRLSRLASKIQHYYDDDLEDEEDNSYDHRLIELTMSLHKESTYSLWDVYYLSINYVLGVGCLGVPYAFARAGFMMCAFILLVVTVFSYMTVMWVAESGDRFQRQVKNERKESGERTSLVSHTILEDDRFEVIDLVQHYLGDFQKLLYQVALMALMYIGLLAYSQVFCGAIAAILWGSKEAGALPQIFFACMVIPLSCMDLEEQVSIQAFMAAARFVAIFIIVFGSVSALALDDSISEQPHAPYWAPAEPEGCTMSYTSCFSGFGVAFSTAVFSQLFQHSVPGLLRPLRKQPGQLREVPRTMGATLLTTSTFYLLLGTTAASYFGADTKSSINLNFAQFTFGFDASSVPKWFLVLIRIASNIVVIFPALDTVSVFPLIANTLGNNLYAAAGPDMVKGLSRRIVELQGWLHGNYANGCCSNEAFDSLSLAEKKEANEAASKVSSLFWRLVAALPPLLGSLVATDLSFSLLLAGVAGVHVAFLAPALLQLQSTRQSGSPSTFSGWYSPTTLCYPVLIFATFALCVVLLHIRDAIASGF